MDLNKLTLGEKIIGGAGILLLLTLLIAPWHKVDLGFDIAGVDDEITRKATQSPNGFWGVLALLLTIAVVAVVLIRKLTTTKLPDLPISWAKAIFFATLAILGVLLLKLVIETDALGWGSYLAIILAAGMAYGGFLVSKEPEGIGAPGSGPATPF